MAVCLLAGTPALLPSCKDFYRHPPFKFRLNLDLNTCFVSLIVFKQLIIDSNETKQAWQTEAQVAVPGQNIEEHLEAEGTA